MEKKLYVVIGAVLVYVASLFNSALEAINFFSAMALVCAVIGVVHAILLSGERYINRDERDRQIACFFLVIVFIGLFYGWEAIIR